jgi:hypothetical protein
MFILHAGQPQDQAVREMLSENHWNNYPWSCLLSPTRSWMVFCGNSHLKEETLNTTMMTDDCPLTTCIAVLTLYKCLASDHSMRADRRDIVAVSTRSLHGPRPTGAAPADFSECTSSSVKSEKYGWPY